MPLPDLKWLYAELVVPPPKDLMVHMPGGFCEEIHLPAMAGDAEPSLPGTMSEPDAE